MTLKYFYEKIMQEISTQKLGSDPFLNNPKQPLHARNYFEIKLSNPVPRNGQN